MDCRQPHAPAPGHPASTPSVQPYAVSSTLHLTRRASRRRPDPPPCGITPPAPPASRRSIDVDAHPLSHPQTDHDPIRRLPLTLLDATAAATVDGRRLLLKASRPLIRVLVINDNHRGLTFLFEI
jgi:hypothetical protein